MKENKCFSPGTIDSRAFRIELASSYFFGKKVEKVSCAPWKNLLHARTPLLCLKAMHHRQLSLASLLGFFHHLNASFNTFLPHSPIKGLLGNKNGNNTITTWCSQRKHYAMTREAIDQLICPKLQKCSMCSKVAPFFLASLDLISTCKPGTIADQWPAEQTVLGGTKNAFTSSWMNCCLQ